MASSVLLAVALGVGSWLRLRGLTEGCPTTDEAWTFQRANEDMDREVWTLGPSFTRKQLAFYLVVKAVYALGFEGPYVMRFVSAVAAVATVALVFVVARDLWNRSTGALAALLFAITPFHVMLGRYARSYALLELGIVGAAVLWTRVLRAPPSPGRRALAFWAVGVSLAAASLHYAALPLLVLPVGLLVRGLRRGDRALQDALVALVVGSVPLALLAAIDFRGGAARGTEWVFQHHEDVRVMAAQIAAPFPWWLVVAALVSLGPRLRRDGALALFLVAGLLPVAVALGGHALYKPVLLLRYAAPHATLLLPVLARAVTVWTDRWGPAAWSFLVLPGLAWEPGRALVVQEPPNDACRAVAALTSWAPPGAVVVTNSGPAVPLLRGFGYPTEGDGTAPRFALLARGGGPLPRGTSRILVQPVLRAYDAGSTLAVEVGGAPGVPLGAYALERGYAPPAPPPLPKRR